MMTCIYFLDLWLSFLFLQDILILASPWFVHTHTLIYRRIGPREPSSTSSLLLKIQNANEGIPTFDPSLI